MPCLTDTQHTYLKDTHRDPQRRLAFLADVSAWIADHDHRSGIVLGLSLVPAGIVAVLGAHGVP
jgi:hypothetical protein